MSENKDLTHETSVFINSDKYTMYNKGIELGLSEKAARKFAYCCYELEILVKYNPKTGDCKEVELK